MAAAPTAPAPTHTTSPDAQSWSSWPGLKPGTRRGSTSDSHNDTGNESPCSGTSASRSVARRSIPCQCGRKRPNAACSAGSTSLRSAASDARRSRLRYRFSAVSSSVMETFRQKLLAGMRARGYEEDFANRVLISADLDEHAAGQHGHPGPAEYVKIG